MTAIAFVEEHIVELMIQYILCCDEGSCRSYSPAWLMKGSNFLTLGIF